MQPPFPILCFPTSCDSPSKIAPLLWRTLKTRGVVSSYYLSAHYLDPLSNSERRFCISPPIFVANFLTGSAAVARLMDPGLLQPIQPPHTHSMIIHATSPQIEFSRATRLRAPGMILVAQRHAAYGMMQATGHDGHLCPVVAGRKIVDHLLRGWKYTSCSLSRPSSGAFLRRSSISRCSLPRHSVHTRSTRFLSLLLRGALFLMFARQLLMLFTICQDIGLRGNKNKLQQRARENSQIVFPVIFYNLTVLVTSLATCWN